MTKSVIRAAMALAPVGVPAPAFADPSCVAHASDKKLSGAAKTSFTNKCVADAAGE